MLVNDTSLPATFGPLLIRNNVFEIDSETAAGTAGVEIASTTGSHVENNTIVETPTSPLPVDGLLLSGTASVVVNNIISVGDLCIAARTMPDELRNNDLHACPLLFADSTAPAPANALQDIDQVNNLAGAIASGNLAIDPVLDVSAGFALTNASPRAVSEGGLDRSTSFVEDALGRPRTVPWSVGAFEFDP